MHHNALMELIIDPQTCGPLLVATSIELEDELLSTGLWKKIGHVFSD